MVLSEGSFKQAQPSLECIGNPLGYETSCGIVRCPEIRASIVDVGQDGIHHQRSRIAVSVQVRVRHVEGFVYPGNISEAYNLLKIEVRSEKSRDALIMSSHVIGKA